MATFRERRRLRAHTLAITCDHAGAIAYNDLLDLYLAGSGVRHWEWVDVRGRRVPGQRASVSLSRVARDLLRWPALYRRHARRIAKLTSAAPVHAKLTSPRRALFLRTDHWFNLGSGGSVGHVRGVVEGLRNLPVDVHVVSTDYLPGVPADDRFHLCEPDYGIGRNLPSMAELQYNDQVVGFIRERWAEWAPSFIYQRYSMANYAGTVLRSLYQVPYVCEYNGSFPWVIRQWTKRRLVHEGLVTRVELLNLQTADLVIVVSNGLRDELVGRGVSPERILVNPNGVDPDRYSPTINGSPVRRRYGLEKRLVIGFIGTFGPWHGAEVLAEAFARLLFFSPAYRDRARLLLIGEGPTLEATRERLRQAGALDSVVFTGRVPQDEGPAHLAACDILASPHVPNPDGSPFFGSPTKLFEYMAMGRGIVASRIEQVAEVLKHDSTAWLVPPADPEALAEGLRVLVDDPERRGRLGSAARVEVIARYTWREHTRRIIDKLMERCG